MATAFVDTTILADLLLKTGKSNLRAREFLSRFSITLLPVYAIKEFKFGPLESFIWFHNRVASSGSFEKAVDSLRAMSRTPRRYRTSTAIEALREVAEKFSDLQLVDLVKVYGEKANLDKVLADRIRLELKNRIFRAWKKRRRVTTQVVEPLACFSEEDPYERERIIFWTNTKCKDQPECSMANNLRERKEELVKLQVVCEGRAKKEAARCAIVLKGLAAGDGFRLDHDLCRSLGDAVFALFSPNRAFIVTTNTDDHEPLAEALGKRVYIEGQDLALLELQSDSPVGIPEERAEGEQIAQV